MRGVCSRSTFAKYCPPPTIKALSTITPVRIIGLLGDRVDDPLHITRGKTGIYILSLEVVKVLVFWEQGDV